jgi:hypothetical protein
LGLPPLCLALEIIFIISTQINGVTNLSEGVEHGPASKYCSLSGEETFANVGTNLRAESARPSIWGCDRELGFGEALIVKSPVSSGHTRVPQWALVGRTSFSCSETSSLLQKHVLRNAGIWEREMQNNGYKSYMLSLSCQSPSAPFVMAPFMFCSWENRKMNGNKYRARLQT